MAEAVADESTKQYPLPEVGDLRFSYEKTKNKDSLAKLLAIIKEEKMTVYYKSFCEAFPEVKLDSALLAQMEKENATELEGIEVKIKDAQENAGDIEVKNATLLKADFYNRIGDKTKALEIYDQALEKTVGVGGKMDNVLTKIRMGLVYGDVNLAKHQIEYAKTELKSGGDWERKNKLQVYEGIYKMVTRDFKTAAGKFLDSLATFTATEIVGFNDYIFYAALCSMVAMTRTDIKNRVTESPEILAAIHEKPHMKEFLFAYYYCDYKTYMKEFVGVIDLIRGNRYLEPHVNYLTKQLRINAYRQFITSYKSVTLQSMAEQFGVSPQFLDEEIYGLISTGKLACQIDKISNIIETSQGEDPKSSAFEKIVKEGDLLLSKMQKIASMVDR